MQSGAEIESRRCRFKEDTRAMKAAQLFVKCLENENVRFIFGLPGEENMDVLDALLDSAIEFIPTRHEQGAAFMADVQGRLTHTAGVCLSTLGPGATNLVTGVADGNLDRAPLVAVTGQAGLDRMHKESHQVIDIVELFKPVTKWNTQIRKASIIPEVVRKAFKLAMTERPGATHIDFPEDEASAQVSDALEPLLVQFPVPPEPLEAQVKRASDIISGARRPVILAGNGVIRANAEDDLVRFCEKLNIPVCSTFMAKGVVPASHPLSLFSVGLQEPDYAWCALDRSDVVICVGYDIVEYHPELWNPNKNKRIVHIDLLPAEVDDSYIVSVGVAGDIRLSLREIADRSQASENRSFTRLRELCLTEIEEAKHDRSFPLKPQNVVVDLRSVLADDDIVISDVGVHKLWLARLYAAEKPNTCIISNGFSAMGIAVPGAISAKLHFPQARVVAATGDGGFLMNSQELETAVRLETPFVSLIFNDGMYGLIGWKQQTRFNREAFVRFRNPDFVRYAASFGAKGYRVSAHDELVPALQEAMEESVPTVIDCPIDFGENVKLTKKLQELVCPE